jgi:hypothetical protein
VCVLSFFAPPDIENDRHRFLNIKALAKYTLEKRGNCFNSHGWVKRVDNSQARASLQGCDLYILRQPGTSNVVWHVIHGFDSFYGDIAVIRGSEAHNFDQMAALTEAKRGIAFNKLRSIDTQQIQFFQVLGGSNIRSSHANTWKEDNTGLLYETSMEFGILQQERLSSHGIVLPKLLTLFLPLTKQLLDFEQFFNLLESRVTRIKVRFCCESILKFVPNPRKSRQAGKRAQHVCP